jgi:hypothetical protein
MRTAVPSQAGASPSDLGSSPPGATASPLSGAARAAFEATLRERLGAFLDDTTRLRCAVLRAVAGLPRPLTFGEESNQGLQTTLLPPPGKRYLRLLARGRFQNL